MNYKSYLKNKLFDFFTSRWSKGMARAESIEMGQLNLNGLTSEEMKSVKTIWGKIISPSPKYYQMFKTLEGFNSQFVSVDVYYPIIMRALNPLAYSKSFSHKGFYPFLYKDIPQPRFYINRVRGVYYNSELKVITRNEAIYILKQVDEVIIKVTKNTGCGKNVSKIQPRKENLELLIDDFGEDYIVQEVLKQPEYTAKYNPQSLNSFRISTLNINGRCSLCSAVFRCGQNGATVDNTGSGGIMVGVGEDGRFREYGYDMKYNRHYKSSNGIEFKDGYIPNMHKIIETVIQWHQRYLPNLGHCGWDIALNEDGNPVFIEVNLVYPGIQYEQICVGKPHFGERTDELIQFVMKNKPRFEIANAVD